MRHKRKSLVVGMKKWAVQSHVVAVRLHVVGGKANEWVASDVAQEEVLDGGRQRWESAVEHGTDNDEEERDLE